jgi:hypothetical protein
MPIVGNMPLGHSSVAMSKSKYQRTFTVGMDTNYTFTAPGGMDN